MFTTSQDAFGVDQLQSWPTPIIFINTMSFPALPPNGSITNPSYSFAAQTDMGIYRAGASDMRVAMNSQDIAIFTRVTASGVTNGSTIGIGAVPLRPGYCLDLNSNSTLYSGMTQNNPNTTDFASMGGVSFRTTTTNAGAAAYSELASFRAICSVHDNATQSSNFEFNWQSTAVAKKFQFLGDHTFTNSTGPMTIQTGAANGNLILSPNGSGSITLATAKPLRIQTGSNQRAGTATLVAGTVTVANTTVTANTIIAQNVKTIGGAVGTLSYTINAGVGFTINSSNAADTSTISYLLLEVS